MKSFVPLLCVAREGICILTNSPTAKHLTPSRELILGLGFELDSTIGRRNGIQRRTLRKRRQNFRGAKAWVSLGRLLEMAQPF
jgi:hypothetical protein